ncbi:site-specific DNA-methyltransferase [Corynebacterium glutamicum]|uniref:site-specific DNA-methyltransferase n=1 Tax=Corynebacterium glutamicum TaxID=1718 RepID=UPI003B5ACEF0
MNDDINHIPSNTPDFQTELAEKLAELAPEAIADGKIDVKKLKELLADDADESNERFGLFWPGKRRALRAAQQPTTATLKPDVENSKDWDTTKNVFIEGDNLEVLKVLQKHYHGKIKMIYIDPPYNTGKDFVYPDNFKEGLGTYLEWTKQVNDEGQKLATNSESEGRFHSNWLNMMYPRLKLARNLLSNDGAIFISIDDHEQDNLRKTCNEIFGEQNFLGVIIWRTATDNNPTNVATDHEYVLVYARNISCTGNWEATSSKAALIAQRYSEIRSEIGDDLTLVQSELRKWIRTAAKSGDVDLDGVSHYSYVDERGVYYPGNSSNTKPGDYRYDIIHPVTGEVTAKPANGWRWPKTTFDRAAEMNDVHWGADHTSVPKIKKRIETATELLKSFYYEDNRGTTAMVTDLFEGVKVFDNPKSLGLLRHIMKFTTTGDDLILDFFSGSGSTAHAVMEMNAQDGGSRRHIQVQLPEPTPEKSEARKAGYVTISSISSERIRRAGEKIQKDFSEQLSQRDAPLDVGFRAYKLSDTNFSKWQFSSDTLANELEQHLLELRESANDNATPADLFIELLLKQGYSLTEGIGDASIAGLDLKTVLDADGDVAVLSYLDEHTKPTIDQLREIADSKPVRFVILEDCFQGDDELKTNLVQICKTNGIELWTA